MVSGRIGTAVSLFWLRKVGVEKRVVGYSRCNSGQPGTVTIGEGFEGCSLGQ